MLTDQSFTFSFPCYVLAEHQRGPNQKQQFATIKSHPGAPNALVLFTDRTLAEKLAAMAGPASHLVALDTLGDVVAVLRQRPDDVPKLAINFGGERQILADINRISASLERQLAELS